MKVLSLRRQGWRTGLVISILTFGFLAGAPLARANVYEVEGETYSAWNNIGGRNIQIASCHAASGGLTADGIDVPGEWIRLQITLPGSACYEDLVGFMSYEGDTNRVRMTVLGPDSWDEAAVANFTFVGAGVG